MQGDGLKIDMRGKTVFVAGVADSTGYGWAIAKACAEAGAKIVLGTWPPVLPIFQMGIERGQYEADTKLSNGSNMKIDKVRLITLLHLQHTKTKLSPIKPIRRLTGGIFPFFLLLTYLSMALPCFLRHRTDLPSRCNIRHQGEHSRGGGQRQEIQVVLWVFYPGGGRLGGQRFWKD